MSAKQIGWAYLPAIRILPRRMTGNCLSDELWSFFWGDLESNCPPSRGMDSASLGTFLTQRWRVGVGNDSIIKTLVCSWREGRVFLRA